MSGQTTTIPIANSFGLKGVRILSAFAQVEREGGSSRKTFHLVLEGNVELVFGSEFVVGAGGDGTLATVWVRPSFLPDKDGFGEIVFRE